MYTPTLSLSVYSLCVCVFVSISLSLSVTHTCTNARIQTHSRTYQYAPKDWMFKVSFGFATSMHSIYAHTRTPTRRECVRVCACEREGEKGREGARESKIWLDCDCSLCKNLFDKGGHPWSSVSITTLGTRFFSYRGNCKCFSSYEHHNPGKMAFE